MTNEVTMQMKLVFAIAGVLLLAVPSAHADIYKCVGSDGHVTYSNMGDRNCKRLSLDPVPASTSAPASAAAGKPAAAKSPTPAGFPKVEEGAQKSRDNDRRRILEGELAAEQKNLEQAKKEMADQEAVRLGGERNYQRVIDRVQPFKDKVALHERNIEAIQSEISRLR